MQKLARETEGGGRRGGGSSSPWKKLLGADKLPLDQVRSAVFR